MAIFSHEPSKLHFKHLSQHFHSISETFSGWWGSLSEISRWSLLIVEINPILKIPNYLPKGKHSLSVCSSLPGPWACLFWLIVVKVKSWIAFLSDPIYLIWWLYHSLDHGIPKYRRCSCTGWEGGITSGRGVWHDQSKANGSLHSEDLNLYLPEKEAELALVQ